MLNVFYGLITFGAAPVVLAGQLTDIAGNPMQTTRAQRLYIEPCVGNAHDCFVEQLGVLTAATGATLGVLRVLAKPPAANSGTLTDFFEMSTQREHGIDLNAFQVDGYSHLGVGETCRVTAFA